MKPLWKLGVLLLWLVGWDRAGGAGDGIRSIPSPREDHPGNVFVVGEEVTLRLAAGDAALWHLLDYDEQEVGPVRVRDGVVALGRLPVGFYRLRAEGRADWVSCAVIAPLRAPTPRTSPVALDVAMSWFYPREKMDAVSSLCALAGVNWVRDRLAWAELEPQPGDWAGPNRYDDAARAQSQRGLQVLQVNHLSPSWANPTTSRFPLDLRHAYRFYREMARRWRGRVLAFEPWNEADIPGFGGHTGAEMAALQKASYLGLKAGAADTIACWNVFALPNARQLADLHANEAWPYFDTFNLHHYAAFDEYPKVYAAFRAVSAGRPLWVSECAVPVPWAGDEKLKEPTDTDLRTQAERVAKTFAGSLHEGAANTFFFLLPHFVEGQTQFGLLRPDLTPRPGYVALAAVGRFLADARPVGQLAMVPANVRAFLFRAHPDGREAYVLIAWTTDGQTDLALSTAPRAVFDHLGRPVVAAVSLALTSAPVFALLPDEGVKQLQLRPPPQPPSRLPGEPSPVVLQALMPQESLLLSQSAYRISSQQRESIPLFVYNFSAAPVTGRLRVTVPEGWQANEFEELEIASQSRAELRLELDGRHGVPRFLATIRVVGDFGSAGRPVLSVRVVPEPSLLMRQTGIPIAGSDDARLWQVTASGGGAAAIHREAPALRVEAEPQGPDRWVYAEFKLPARQRPPPGAVGLGCALVVQEGDGIFRAIFAEENGSSYVADFFPQVKPGEQVEVVALFEQVTHGAGWSKPDPNGELDPGEIAALKIGGNLKSGRVQFAFQSLRWLVR